MTTAKIISPDDLLPKADVRDELTRTIEDINAQLQDPMRRKKCQEPAQQGQYFRVSTYATLTREQVKQLELSCVDGGWQGVSVMYWMDSQTLLVSLSAGTPFASASSSTVFSSREPEFAA